MRQWFIVLLAALVLTVPSWAPAKADSCQFVLGFQALHDLIPSQVGSCLDNEAHNPANGDALQHSAGGLLVWRKLDNWTAFTDGYNTAVNGPAGLQWRLNTERFPWEANPEGFPLVGASAAPVAVAPAPTPTPVPGTYVCRTQVETNALIAEIRLNDAKLRLDIHQLQQILASRAPSPANAAQRAIVQAAIDNDNAQLALDAQYLAWLTNPATALLCRY